MRTATRAIAHSVYPTKYANLALLRADNRILRLGLCKARMARTPVNRMGEVYNWGSGEVVILISSRQAIVGITVLALALLAAACSQPEEPTAVLQGTDTPGAAPTSEPTDRSIPPPATQPTNTPTPATQPPGAAGADPAPVATEAPEATASDQGAVIPLGCAALDPTSTPDPNRPEGILGMSSEFWNVSSFEEAECITGYPVYVPSNLPDEFTRSETIVVNKVGTKDWEDVFVEHGWFIPGDPPYGVRLSQHTRTFGLGNGEPAVINGFPGERMLDPERPPDFPQGLTLLWKQDGYWFTVFGFLHGPVTEEFLLKVAASLRIPNE